MLGYFISFGNWINSIKLNIPSAIAGIQSLITQQDNQTNATPNKPRAFINVVFFDEEFKSYDFRLSMVGSNSIVKDHYSELQNIAATKSGYVYIYCSNESPVNVFFDNLQVVHTRSPILEENHYFSYGLKIASISSKAAGSLQNSYLYQGDFSEFDDETGYNEFYLRHYDAQIGRWTTTDPYEQFSSPYLGMGNSPGGMVDPDGGFNILIIADLGSDFLNAAGNSLIGAAVGYGIGSLVGGKDGGKWGAALGFGMVAGSYVTWDDVGSWIGGLFQKPDWWLLYEGQRVILYKGNYGNTSKSKEKERYKASSGIVTYKDPAGKELGDDYRNSKYQFKKVKVNEGGEIKTINVGPIPEGNYSVNLSLNPNRKWQLDKGGNSIPGHGIEQIGTDYPEWGTIRARLEILPGTVTNGRDYFYFHNSTKGYSHGCVETQMGLFKKFYELRKNGATEIRVKVKYQTLNQSTYGGTDKN